MSFEGWITDYEPQKQCGTITFGDGRTIQFYKRQCNSTIRKRLYAGERPPVAFEIGFRGPTDSDAHAIDIKGRTIEAPMKESPFNKAQLFHKDRSDFHVDRVVKAKIHTEFPEPPRLSEIIRYQQENWEEIQALIDPPAEIEASRSLLETPAPEDYLALGIFNDKVRLVRLASDGKYSFVDAERQTHRILYPSVYPDIKLAWAIEEFEDLINSNPREADLQRFLEQHQEFILGDEYRYAHPHLTLVSNDGNELIPDFILQPVNQLAFCDLLELKLPTTDPFIFKKNRHRYSAAIEDAAAQLRTYASFFDDMDNLLRFTLRYPHLNIYKPRMFVIIGRDTPDMLREKQTIRSTLPDLNLKTYDELLTRMRWRKELLRKGGPIIGY